LSGIRSERFRQTGQSRIEALIAGHIEALRDEIPLFAEDNYDRRDAGERWWRHVEQRGIERSVERIQKEFQNEFRAAVGELVRELTVELRLVGGFAGDRRISMDSIFDTKRALKWGMNILVGGLGLAAMFLGGPLTWAAFAVGAVGRLVLLFTEDREVKAKRRREDLGRRLSRNVDTIERNLRSELSDMFNQKLLREQADVVIADLATFGAGIRELASAQRELAWIQVRAQKKLHLVLLGKALDKLGITEFAKCTVDVARVPGVAMMLVVQPGTAFPSKLRTRLQKLMGETLWLIDRAADRETMLSRAIGHGCDLHDITIDEKAQVAHVRTGELSAEGVFRVRLAQQLTELHVMR
jgi:hypothetical protein